MMQRQRHMCIYRDRGKDRDRGRDRDEEATKEEKKEGDDDDAKVEEVKEEEEKPKTKKVEKTTWDWELINQSKPIWTRKPTQISEDEYSEFYKSITKDSTAPLTHSHFIAEGEVTFKSLIFIPGSSDNYVQIKSNNFCTLKDKLKSSSNEINIEHEVKNSDLFGCRT